MPTATIDVDTDVFVSAGDLFLDVNNTVCDAVAAASTSAGEAGGMAGTDSGGVDWASAYDEAATSALTTGATLAASIGHVGELLALSADNHAGADRSSVPGGPPAYPGDGGPRRAAGVVPARPPSANGTSADPPPGWFLVAHLLQYTWPNGHQDQLHTVSSGWSRAAEALDLDADRLSRAIGDVSMLRSPEVDAAVDTCCEVQRSARDLSSAYRTLAGACSDYAQHLDEAHSEVLRELAELAAETAIIQAVSAAAAVPSLGSSEAVGQAAQGARLGLAATRIGAVLGKLIEVVRAVSSVVRAVVTRVGNVLMKLRAVLARGGTRAVETVSRLPQLSRVRRLTYSLDSLEKKYKHAADFGVTLPRGRAGFAAFGKAVQAFVRSPTTTRVSRPFRGQPAILNYDINSMLAVVQKPSGEFITGWKMSPAQFRNVLAGRPLSGG